MVERIEEGAKKRRVGIYCKDIREIEFELKEKTAKITFISVLKLIAFDHEIKHLFAFSYSPVYYSSFQKFVFNIDAEYSRLGFFKTNSQWRVSDINAEYTFCSSYPRRWIVPKTASDLLLQKVAKFRSKGRLPVATYLYKANATAMFRSAQPLVGITSNRSEEDESYLQLLSQTATKLNFGETPTLYIVDARPKVNAVGNKFRGAGYESVGKGGNYVNCQLEFVNIQNIHVMRTSVKQLHKVCQDRGEYDDQTWWTYVENTQWLEHIEKVLSGAVRVATLIQRGKPVLVHCSDGFLFPHFFFVLDFLSFLKVGTEQVSSLLFPRSC